MAQRKVQITELGREKFCPRCKELWPADLEFFYSAGKRKLTAWCKACYLEWRNARQCAERSNTKEGHHANPS